jgi:hypothetical protein
LLPISSIPNIRFFKLSMRPVKPLSVLSNTLSCSGSPNALMPAYIAPVLAQPDRPRRETTTPAVDIYSIKVVPNPARQDMACISKFGRLSMLADSCQRSYVPTALKCLATPLMYGDTGDSTKSLSIVISLLPITKLLLAHSFSSLILAVQPNCIRICWALPTLIMY